jgi:hypothetical protein
LLAIVPAERAADLIATFEARGEPAFLIGQIDDGAPLVIAA